MKYLIPFVVSSVEGYLSAKEMAASPAESARLQKELADVTAQIERLRKLLESDFAGKAPAAVVEKERQRLAAFEQTAGKLKEQLKG